MDYKINKLPKAQLEITIEVPLEELQSYLERAAQHLSIHHKIAGFRPGKAPYDLVKNQLGEIKIYEEAAEAVVRKTYIEIIDKEKLNTLGEPEIRIEKIAPGNPLLYRALVNLLPEIKLGDWQKIKVTKKAIEIKPEQVKKIISDLAGFKASEALVDRPAQKTDKVEIDMEMFKDKVSIEGGIAKSHFVYLGDEHYIPGFNDKLTGLEKDAEREFQLPFPAEHYNKNLAGQPIDFKIKVKNIYERKIPEINDEFAKGLGKFANLGQLETQIKNNLTQEAQIKEAERQEIEMLGQLVNISSFSDIPHVLLENEKETMAEELKENIFRQGLDFNDYLGHLKKTEAELKQEFADQALRRIKTALLLKQIQKEEKIKASDADIDEEIAKTKKLYPQISATDLARLESQSYRNYAANILANRKAIQFLKEKIIK